MLRLFRTTLLAASFTVTYSQSALADAELEELAQKTANPISDAWLLITQNDFTVLDGDGVNSQNLNVFSFRPVLSFPMLDDSWNLLVRPVVPIISAPLDEDSLDDDFTGDPLDGRTTGLGDTVLLTIAGPNRDDGIIWGLGTSFIFPTASEDVLGAEKWSAGPAGLWARLGSESGGLGLNNWNIGFLPQHWWSYGGDSDRDAFSQTDIQYFINWRQNSTRLIGMTPNIRINWKESGSDKYSVPIGLGSIDIFRWGKVPVRWGVELQYYVMQPDPIAPEWNFRFFFAPIAPNPMKKRQELALSGLFDKYAGRQQGY